MPSRMINAEEADILAEAFHESYERQAKDFDYETRKSSAVPWKDVPENNKALMKGVMKDLFYVDSDGYIHIHTRRPIDG